MTLVLFILLAYLLGSVPFAMVSSRLFGLADPRSYGSKNPGATNVLRSGNKLAALVTLIGDGAKGWLAVTLAAAYAPAWGLGEEAAALAGLAAFFGHVFPVFLGFKGGKGVATALGVLLAFHPLIGLISFGIWLAIAAIFRYSSLAALGAALAAPLVSAWLTDTGAAAYAVTVMSTLLVWRHAANVRRLIAGTEPRIGGKKA